MHVSRSVVVIGLKLNLLLELLRKPQHKALHYRYYDVCNCTIKLLKFIIQLKLRAVWILLLLLYLAIELSLSYKTSENVSIDFWDFF